MKPVLFGEAWNDEVGKLMRPLDSEAARTRFANKRPVAMAFGATPAKLTGVVSANKHAFMVNFLDGKLRTTVKYIFVRHRKTLLFLQQAFVAEFGRRTTTTFTFRFEEDGTYEVTSHNETTDELESRRGIFDAKKNFEEAPDFDNFGRLLERDRADLLRDAP